MTQETLDMVVHAYCEGCQEFIGDYELEVQLSPFKKDIYHLFVKNKSIENMFLPFEIIKDHYTPKEKAKIVISLLEQIVENGHQWLRDEENYHGDKMAEKGDNDYKERLEND
jgi:hypothetical protein